MPQPLSLPHKRQIADGYCLAACAEMVLAYWGVAIAQESLANLLGIIAHLGAPASRIMRLEAHGMKVACGVGEWELLHHWLKKQVPLVTAIQAGELAHWQGDSFQHAIVVVGVDETAVYLLDPASEIAPLRVDLDEFLLAWGEMNYWYAVVQPLGDLA